MAVLRLRLPPAESRAISRLVKKLSSLQGPALSEAADWLKATLEPLCLEIAVYKLVQQLKVRHAAKRVAAAHILEALGPVAAPQLVADLYDSKDTAFRLRLLQVMTAIGPAARDVLAPAFIQILVNQPEQVLCDAGWKGLMRLGAHRKAHPEDGTI